MTFEHNGLDFIVEVNDEKGHGNARRYQLTVEGNADGTWNGWFDGPAALTKAELRSHAVKAYEESVATVGNTRR